MMLALAVIMMHAALAATVPLTVEQRIALEAARDGYDQREQAFQLLLENVRAWTPGNETGSETQGETGGEAVLARPDDSSLRERPDEFRGKLFELEGVIQQQMRLAQPDEGVMEWFIRTDRGVPLVVYLDERGLGEPWRDGQRVRMLARFYKVMELTGRDGAARRYAAFVAAFPERIAARPRGVALPQTPSWLVVVILVMLSVLGLLVLVARRARRSPRTASSVALGPRVDEGGRLPDDPAEALAELRRRSEMNP